MKSEAKAKYLVVDTTGFIKNLQLQELAENVISLEEVVNEIKSRRQLKRLAVIPYDLTIKPVFPEHVKTVTEFSKKTGDFPCLSAVDMKVMALTYQLEKEHVGTDHLNESPKVQMTVENYKPDVSFDNVAGFYYKDKDKDKADGDTVVNKDEEVLIIDKLNDLEVGENVEDCKEREVISESGKPEECIKEVALGSFPSADNIVRSLSKLEDLKSETGNGKVSSSRRETGEDEPGFSNEDSGVGIRESGLSQGDSPDDLTPSPPDDQIELGYSSDDEGDDSLSDDNFFDDDKNGAVGKRSDDTMILKRIEQSSQDLGDLSDDDSLYDDDDDSGWITPSNVTQAKRDSTSGVLSEEPVTVACLTTDFAMQNVLLQMGLNVMAVDGRIIKQVRTYILRCHACGKTTSIMTKVFCPKCGLKTLKRVAVSVDPDGKQHIFINYKRHISAKGKRCSIPRPQGGKHANNPIVVEDQRVPQQRLSKKAMQRTNALEPDYIAGFSPFVMRDTTSRSVMLGFHTSRQNAKHLVGRNPNKKIGKRKK